MREHFISNDSFYFWQYTSLLKIVKTIHEEKVMQEGYTNIAK